MEGFSALWSIGKLKEQEDGAQGADPRKIPPPEAVAPRDFGDPAARPLEARHLPQNPADILLDADRPPGDFPRGERLREVDAGVDGPRVFVRKLPERVFDDGRRIPAHAQLQKEHPPPP